MHWQRRMLAIVLAGGSIAGCSDPSASGGDRAAEPTRGTPRGAGAPPAASLEASTPAPAPGGGTVVVPRCNANPDPCCLDPEAPGCRVDAASPDAGEACDAEDQE